VFGRVGELHPLEWEDTGRALAQRPAGSNVTLAGLAELKKKSGELNQRRRPT